MPQGALHPEPQQRPARPDDALDSRYQLRIGLLLADRPESAEYSQILQTLPERGFNLLYLMTSLLLVLLVSAAVLKVMLPRLRRSYRARVAGSLLLPATSPSCCCTASWCSSWGIPVLVGLSARAHHLAWGSMVLGWSLCALAGFSLYMGLLFTALSGIGLLANFMKIAIYGVPLGTIWATCWPCCTSCSISTLWCRCSSCWGSSFWCGALPSPLDPAGLAAHRRHRHLRPLRVRHPDRQQAARGQHPLRGQGGELPQGHHPRRPRPLPVQPGGRDAAKRQRVSLPLADQRGTPELSLPAQPRAPLLRSGDRAAIRVALA